MSCMRQFAPNWHSNVDAPRLSGGAKISPIKVMTRNVSWDPNVTVVEPRAHQRNDHSPRKALREPQQSTLHPILSSESSNVIFDARLAPALITPTASHSVGEPATTSGACRLRLVSREFPWTIDVQNSKQTSVTCADVFGALYAGLSVPITSAEWTLADDRKKESMQRANRTRRGGGSVKRLRRIDWLGSRIYFKGLSRDDELSKSRLFPEDELWPDTWVVELGSRR